MVILASPFCLGDDRDAEEFTEFFGGFLYGPRIDPLWDEKTDTPDLQELDWRIQVVERFLGPAGADLIKLREKLALGMARHEYELAAFFAIRKIGSYVYEFQSPPKFYYGHIGRDQIKVALRWLDSREVLGLYFHAPPGWQGVDHYGMLEGLNTRQGHVYFEEMDGPTNTAKIYLKKRMT